MILCFCFPVAVFFRKCVRIGGVRTNWRVYPIRCTAHLGGRGACTYGTHVVPPGASFQIFPGGRQRRLGERNEPNQRGGGGGGGGPSKPPQYFFFYFELFCDF